MASANQERSGIFSRGCWWFKALWERIVSKVVGTPRNLRSLGQEDPRRMIHSVRVGIAIALVSLLYYFDPIYDGFGVSAMWAVITVVVMFEFSVGATIGKGINRGIATLTGGFLGVGAHLLASFPGNDALEPIILALFIFSVENLTFGTHFLDAAAMVTFVRFFPKLKARYDYGLLIFNLTFSLICFPGYRDDEVIDIAFKRLSTIFIGGTATILVCIVIFPVWVGADVHNLVADNIEKLGNFLEGFGDEYFKASDDENASQDKKELLDEYKSVLTSKTIEDTLVNAARWEPRHGKFRYRHPWGQYQKIGGLTRECAYRLDSLNAYLKEETQTPPEIRARFQQSCKKMSSESSQALKKSAVAIRTMTSSSNATKPHILNAKTAADELKLLLRTNPWQHSDLLDVIPVASVASLLIEIVSCTRRITESVNELASLANFKSLDDRSGEPKDTERAVRTPSLEASHGIDMAAE